MFIGRIRNCRFMLLLGMLLATSVVFSQSFTGIPVQVFEPSIDARLHEWQVFRLNTASLDYEIREAAANNTPVYLNLGKYHWALHPEQNSFFASDYVVRYQGENEEFDRPAAVMPYKGYTDNNDPLRLTLAKDFCYGYVAENGEKIYIEPLWYTNPAFDKDLFLVYAQSDVNWDDMHGTCGMDETAHMKENIDIKVEEKVAANKSVANACYQLDLAIASDASMLSKYGSASAVEAHNVGVLNDVEGDYTGNFARDIHFNIVIQIVSATNPWGAVSDPNTYLNNFTNWGNAGGFGVAYDDAEMWTNIDLDGSVIGLAWRPGVCSSLKYHLLQDFSSNADFLRVLASHEIGHNFNLIHDAAGSPYIMAPAVSASTQWSPTSVSAFNSYSLTLVNNGCLSPCSVGPPPVPEFTWSPDPGCVGQTVTFTSQSTGNISTYSWTFPGGNPATSNQQSPSVVWNTPGVKNVTLTLNSGTGLQAALSKQVTIIGPPTANFTSTVNGLTVSFNAISTNGTSYEWDFGDGSASFDQNPVHTYLEANYYTVVLTVNGPCGTATKTQVVNTAPTANFSASPVVGCAPLAVTFTNESSPNAVSYLWQFPGGTPTSSNQANPVVVYQTSGVFTVTLTATNSAGASVYSVQNYITVQNIPSSSYTSVVNGLTVTFTNTSVNGTSYLWNFGDGQTSTAQNPVHTYATGGSYTVVLSTTNACGTTNNTQTVVLAPPPVAAFTATPSSGCGPLTVQFTNTSSNAASIVWSFPGGTPGTSTANNPVVVYNTPGTYTASLTATNVAGPNTATQTINVLTVPVASFASAVNGATATFTNTSSGATLYSWNFGDGGASSLENPTHTYTSDGVYQVVLTTFNSCGPSTSTQTVTIVTPPVAGFSAATTTGCAPFTVQFNNTSSSNATSYAWQFPGGSPATSTAASPTVVYATPGQYSVTLVATNAAGSNTATQTNYINVITAPAGTFTSAANGLQVNFTSTSANATSYSWNFGDGGTSTLENPVHTYSTAGNYTVTFTAGNICGNGSTTQTVVIVQSPTASFAATPTTGCNNVTVQFSNTSSGNPTSFLWQFPGGTPSSSTDPNPTVVYSAPGAYSVTFTATNSAGSGSTTQTNYINVGTSPVAGFSANGSANNYSFANTSSGATAYSWNFGDNTTSTATNPAHTYTTDGTYTVVLTAINACGTNTSTQTVTVVTPPSANFTATGVNGCAPWSVTFNNTSSANATSFVWQFPGGNPASSTETNPTVVYNSPGVYSVNLTATNAVGSSNVTQTNFITVGTVPSPNFVPSGNGATYSFSNASSGATAYSWNFGDGGTSSGENPSHIYLADGTYTVVLTASNACGSATSSQVVTVATPPTANFTATGNSGCAPITVTFNNLSSSNATSFSWQFPGGNPASSTDVNPVVTYENSGVYAVILTASNNAGNSTVTQTDIVVAGGAPTAGFVPVLNGAQLNVNNISTGATNYTWDFGDGVTSTDAAPAHTYQQDGTYTVTLTSANNCGSATSTATLTVITIPVANFGVSAATGCAPLTVLFNNQSTTNATSFNWEFPGGIPASSTEVNPTVTYSNPGVYAVTLVATNAAGASTEIKADYIVVSGLPVTAFQVQTGGLSADFTNNSFNAQSFFWDFGDGTTSTESNPVHDYAATGTYTVTLSATNDCGTTTYTSEVSIQGTAPLPAFSAGETTKGCAPFTVHFTDESVGQPTSWLWKFPGGTPDTSDQQNPVVVYTSAGVYDVTLKVTNSFGTNSLVKTGLIEVAAAPSASFTSNVGGNGTVTFSNQSQQATSYQWNFGDGSGISTDANPVHTYTQSGTYTVSLTALNDCGSAIFQQIVTVQVVGVSDLADWVNNVQVYPNPNNGKFTLVMNGQPKDELQFELYNTIGQFIKRDVQNFQTGKLTRTFDYGNIPAGTYSLRISDQNSSFVIRISVAE